MLKILLKTNCVMIQIRMNIHYQLICGVQLSS
nr:MAG TPA: hypothetical protein [Bacteriophage sp.]DAK03937.1 MAG TPA: hypothetical protein [Crassvirales sp.]